jgi:hypothetical protein
MPEPLCNQLRASAIVAPVQDAHVLWIGAQVDTRRPRVYFRAFFCTSCEVPRRAIGGFHPDLARPVQLRRVRVQAASAHDRCWPDVGRGAPLMGISRPYRRTCRQFVDGQYAEGGRSQYICHPKFAVSPEHYIRAFLLIQKDLDRLLDFIEPADSNLNTYSYRTHELLLRSCVEVEANCKAILTDNGYSHPGEWNMGDYRKLELSHRLSSYRVRVPFWRGTDAVRHPFAAWSTGGALGWYKAYNATKHDRHAAFGQATFQHLLDAVCGLVALLAAQFWTYDFGPGNTLLALGSTDGMESGIGGYFRVAFPNDWPKTERYDFDWQQLKSEADPFQQFLFA